jgi:hypothetical protein
MRIEIVEAEIIGHENFVELTEGVYRRTKDGAILVIAKDGLNACLLYTD